VHADFWKPLPFDDASFDAAVALHGTLAHPPSDDALRSLVAELARVVRDGGVFVAEVPSPAWLDRLDEASGEDRRVRRTGARTCIYEDLPTGAWIQARVLDDGEWRALLEPVFATRIEPLGETERLVVARRALR
jgi:SAM-dependent methyltransferase